MHQVEVVARGAHGDRERRAAQPDLQRLLGGHGVRPGRVHRPADPQHRRPAGHPSHCTAPTPRRYPRRGPTVSVCPLCRPTAPSCWPAGARPGWAASRSRSSTSVAARMLAAVLAATADAADRIVVGPPQPVPARRAGGPRAAARGRPGGGAARGPDRGRHRRGRRPRRRPAVPHRRAGRPSCGRRSPATACWWSTTAGRDQLLLGVWRTAALRAALPAAGGPTSMRRVVAPLAVRRLRPAVADGVPAAVDRLRHPRRPGAGPRARPPGDPAPPPLPQWQEPTGWTGSPRGSRQGACASSSPEPTARSPAGWAGSSPPAGTRSSA